MEKTMGLTSKETLEKVQKLFDKWFSLNSLLDRQVYLIDIKFNMPSFQKFWHENISHMCPLLADKLQEFGSLRSDLFFRDEVPAHKEDYNNLLELMEDFCLNITSTENLCKEIIQQAIISNDYMYEDFIREYEIKYIAPLVKQGIVFYNAIKQYLENDAEYKWNKDFKSFIITEVKTLISEFNLKEEY